MIPIYSAETVREMDRRTIADAGVPGIELMRRAATALRDALDRSWPADAPVTIFCGSGNNAGDGYLLAALLRQQNRQIRVIAVGDPQRLRGDAAEAFRQAQAAQIDVRPFTECAMPDRGVIVDAMLGTGLAGSVREPYLAAIRQVNATARPVPPVDVPSGIHADTGAILGMAVRARRTVTFVARKSGLYTASGPACTGEIEFIDLGVPGEISSAFDETAFLLELETEMQRLPARTGDAHKGSCGHLCIVAGSPGMGGAGLIAAQGAVRSGCGLVTLATAAENVVAANSVLPEVIARAVSRPDELFPLADSVTAVAIGPGLGTSGAAAKLLNAVLETDLPLVVDADALNLLARGCEWPAGGRTGTVLTPHPGEAGRLLGCSAAEIQADRFAAARALQERFGGTIVLKGAGTVVVDPEGAIGVCTAGNPGMASGGMGDLLTGVIGSLCAQGMAPADAARLGVVLHAMAGDAAAEEGGARGTIASDLLPHLRARINDRV